MEDEIVDETVTEIVDPTEDQIENLATDDITIEIETIKNIDLDATSLDSAQKALDIDTTELDQEVEDTDALSDQLAAEIESRIDALIDGHIIAENNADGEEDPNAENNEDLKLGEKPNEAEFLEAMNNMNEPILGEILDKAEDVDEFLEAMNEIDETIKNEMLQLADINNDGKIDEEELNTLQEDLRAAFEVFDADNSGSISADEFRNAMMNYGNKLSVEQADAMMKDADVNGDGVDYNEFVKWLLSS